MKIEVKVREENSIIEKTTYVENNTGMERAIYKIKGAPVIIDGLKISRIVEYISLSKIADDMYRKKK